jgi:6-phosphogluconolactonase
VAEARRVISVSHTPVEDAAARVIDALAGLGSSAPRLAIAGGSALAAVGLVRQGLLHRLWRQLRLTWVDERCVSQSDSESNRGRAYRARHLEHSDPPGEELPLFLDDEDPEAACTRVGKALHARFDDRLDVLLLGLGADGHVASLFPGHAALVATRPVVVVRDSPKPPACRISLTLPILATAQVAVMLAPGKGKAGVLERLARGDGSLPASALKNLEVFTDLQVGGER